MKSQRRGFRESLLEHRIVELEAEKQTIFNAMLRANERLKHRIEELEDEIRYRDGMEALKNQPNPLEEI